MGGVKKYPYPKAVWSATGGWWWHGGAKKTDRKYLFLFYVLSAATWGFLFKISADNEVSMLLFVY